MSGLRAFRPPSYALDIWPRGRVRQPLVLSNVRGWQARTPIYSEDSHMSGFLAQRRRRMESLMAVASPAEAQTRTIN